MMMRYEEKMKNRQEWGEYRKKADKQAKNKTTYTAFGQWLFDTHDEDKEDNETSLSLSPL
jgi:hypothetical protein